VVDDMMLMMMMMELKEDYIVIYQLLNKENENVLDVHNLLIKKKETKSFLVKF
jgi:hypothetical protein